MTATGNTRRHFTEAAREAAAAARRRKRELKERFPEDHKLVLVLMRAAEAPLSFGWQIRRFGEMRPVAASPGHFPSLAEAERSGEAALAAMRVQDLPH